MPAVDDGLLTPAQVAKTWSVSLRTIQRYIATNKLPAFQLPSGRWRIRPSDAEATLGKNGHNGKLLHEHQEMVERVTAVTRQVAANVEATRRQVCGTIVTAREARRQSQAKQNQ